MAATVSLVSNKKEIEMLLRIGGFELETYGLRAVYIRVGQREWFFGEETPLV